jgi:hypothetical protein
VTGLTNYQDYTFWVRAINAVSSGPDAPFASVTETPVPPPQIVSISPTMATLSLFNNIPAEGMVENAVFDVVGTDLTEQAVLDTDAFSISEFPAWAQPTNLSVEFIDPATATITVTKTVVPNDGDARLGNIGIRNTITHTTTGTLPLSQDAVALHTTFTVTILNSPSGNTAISGQSESVRTFETGETVSLVAGTRDGYSFGNWSSASQSIIDNASNTATSFTMPSHDVIITANWTEGVQQSTPPDTPAETPPGPPPRSPPEPFPATSLENDPGDSPGTDHTIGSGAEGDTGSGENSNSSGTTSQVTGNSAPPSGNPTSGSVAGFGTWFRSNLWWILLVIGAVVATVTSFVIVYKKRRSKKPLIATSGDT